MRILIYAHNWAPSVGGAERYVMMLARGLSRLTANVTVVTPTPAGNFDDSELEFRVVRRPSLAALVGLLRKAEVVQLAGPCFLPLFLAWLLRKPIVVEHHGYPPACPNGLLFHEPTKTVCPGHFLARRYGECLRCNVDTVGWLKSLQMLFLTFPRRWLCRRVAANTPITEHVLKRLSLPRSQVIYYGISEGPTNAEPTSVIPVNGSPLCFAYVGRLVSLKGLPLILEAARSLQRDGYDFRLKFIGDGPEQAALKRLAEKLSLLECTEFAGFVTGTALQAAVKDVAVVLMPSIWEETAGLAAMEQMMRGRLVIASDIGGLGEVVDGGGLRFPAGSAEALAECMRRVLDHPEIISKYGAVARRRALEMFSARQMVEEHFHLYERLTTSAQPGEKVQSAA